MIIVSPALDEINFSRRRGSRAGSFRVCLPASMCVEKLTSCLHCCWELLLACFDSLSWILISWWKKFSFVSWWRLRVMSQNIRLGLLSSQKWDSSISPDTAVSQCCPANDFFSLSIYQNVTATMWHRKGSAGHELCLLLKKMHRTFIMFFSCGEYTESKMSAWSIFKCVIQWH